MAYFDKIVQDSKGLIGNGLEAISSLVGLMESVADDKEKPKAEERRLSKDEIGRTTGKSRTESSSNRRSQHRRTRSQHRRARSSSSFHGDFGAFPLHAQFSEVQDALSRGDFSHVERLTRRFHNRANTFHQHGRRMETADDNPHQRAKGQQCQLLVGCVKGMSLYDAFVRLAGI
jgi:hypothetical protein